MIRGVGFVLAALAAGCATRTTRIAPAANAQLEDQLVRGVVRAAIEADAAGRPADTLYLVGATAVVDGRVALSPPRFAGIGRGGRVNITGLAVEITSGFAWGTVDYRWFPDGGRAPEAVKATVVMERFGGAWRIKHAQSSTIRPIGATR